MKLIWNAIKRTAALIGAEAATIIAGGSIAGVDALVSVLIAATAAALTVWAEIGRAYYKDGKLTEDEVDAAFNQDK